MTRWYRSCPTRWQSFGWHNCRTARWQGYVGMHHIVDEGFICNIAVFSQYRRQGVATALMQELDDYAKENEMASVSLEVRQSNLSAQQLYERVRSRI